MNLLPWLAIVAVAAWAQPLGGRAPAVQPKPEELAQIQSKTEQIEATVKQ